jgi:hypothetical protein
MNEEVRWRDHREGPYIRLLSGRRFHLRDPRPEDFRPEDVAHNLAGINRYTGASRYSVAQHCVVAARCAEKFYPDVALLPAAMLVHDVAESAYGDMSSPLKSLVPDYRELEGKADRAVERRFRINFTTWPIVKEIDDRMWLTESRRLFGEAAKEDYSGPLTPFDAAPLDWFLAWSPERAERTWLAELTRLLPWVKW